MTRRFDWSAVAPAWDRYRDHSRETAEPVIEALLSSASLQQGDRVLELAAGTGELARRISDLVGPTGRVLATDSARGMVALAEETLKDVPNASAALADAADTKLPSGSFDAALSCMGLMFVEEPAVALEEMCRVLAPGGRLAAAVWGGPQHNPWLSCLGMAAMAGGVVSGGPPTGPGGLFSLSDPEVLAAQADKAGLVDFQITEVPITFRAASFDEYYEHVSSLAGPLAVAITNATDDQRAAVRTTVGELSARFATDDGSLALPGLALVLSAKV